MLHRLITYARGLLRRRKVEAEADDELRFHVEMETEANRARGLSIEEARRVALRDLGGVTQTREAVREVRMIWIDAAWQDLRYAVRLLRRQPGFAFGALVTLAIGIGATTAIASAAYGVLLRPLPVHDEGTLVVGYATSAALGGRVPLSYPEYRAWLATGVFEDVAAVRTTRLDLEGDVAERVDVQQVTDNFFQVLGVRAAHGRVFSEADRSALDTPVVISDALWRSRFGANPNAVGQFLKAGGFTLRVVGILPPGMDRWRGSARLWIPIERTIASSTLGSPGYSLFTPIGRLARIVSAADVKRLNSAAAGTEWSRPGSGIRLVPLREDVSSPRLTRLLLVLLASVGLTWLVVCANLSNLLLARGPARAGELTVRLAFGATRGRIVRQLLCESAVLALPGGAIGVWLAIVGIRALAMLGPIGQFNPADARADVPVLLFSVAMTIASGIVCGLVPALTASRAPLARGNAAVAVGRATHIWSRGLVAVEIAVGLVVLVGASLLVESVARIDRVDLGFDPRQVLVFQVNLPVATYGEATSTVDARYVPAQRELLSRLGALPGVERVSFGGSIFVPGAGAAWGTSIAFDDGRRILNGNPKDAPFAPGLNFIGPNYFAVHGVRIIRGREFRVSDDFTAPRVVVINEAMAQMHWPEQDPIGRRVNFAAPSTPSKGFGEPWAEIVGVVADVKQGGVDVPVKPSIYRAALQYPRQDFQVMLRTSVPPDSVAAAARAEVRAFDPTVPMFAARRLSDVVDEASADVRHTSALLAAFAGLTVLLGGVGVYSVLAYSVAARRRELAIRVALGAEPRRLIAGVVRQTLSMLAPGVVVGLAGAALVTRALNVLLYEVSPTDPVVFVGAAVGLMFVAVAAAYVPARRATRLNPVTALRE